MQELNHVEVAKATNGTQAPYSNPYSPVELPASESEAGSWPIFKTSPFGDLWRIGVIATAAVLMLCCVGLMVLLGSYWQYLKRTRALENQ